MRTIQPIFPVLLAVASMLTACLPEPEPAVDEATVLTNNTSVRIAPASSARTLFTINQGERVSIVEKQGAWYRIRDREQIEGWMNESTLITDGTRAAMEALLDQSVGEPVQNTARTREEVYLRLEPGRDTVIIRRLRRGIELQLLDRATTPLPDSNATDIWYKVRSSPDEIGWVFFRLVELDTPEVLRPFMEGRAYVAVLELARVEDPDMGSVSWYVVAERRPQTEPRLAFDGIRVFVWNQAEDEYATTLRLRNLRGLLPLEPAGEGNTTGFRFHVEGTDGEPGGREFAMRGTIPREIQN